MANPGVFYDALDSFLVEKGYDPQKRDGVKQDGHMIRFYLSHVRNSTCGQTGPCVSENVSRLLELMEAVAGWTDEMAESALESAGLKE